jgi:hypothetical protein
MLIFDLGSKRMDRKHFLKVGCCAIAALAGRPASVAETEAPARNDGELTFIQNWVTDLMAALDSHLDDTTKIRLMSECGRGCYRRFQFKQDIAAKGRGNVDKLIAAYKSNFEVWREGENKVHIRYGAVNKNGCFCPAAKYRPGNPNDIQCYCTRASHQAIWENALGKTIGIDILQTVRRGDPTCHFLVNLA